MPANDPVDQKAARAFESSLRDAVNRLDRPPVELEWFAALPKRVCSIMFEPSGLEPGKPSENMKISLPRLAPDLGTLNVFKRRIPQPGTALDDLVSKHAPEAAKALVDVQVVESPGFDVPTRPNTPPMLRDFTRNIPGLLERANGPATAETMAGHRPLSLALHLPHLQPVPRFLPRHTLIP
ncbi:hypothetical protein RhiJN_11912 [Ceratobasidium sp. AG-Ba]|nr:hypothetical protein RhiJN_11912 [Ceratobasidium sp. AG-Ba]